MKAVNQSAAKRGIVAVVIVSALAWIGLAYAGGYSVLGSAWTANTYTHSMHFTANSGDITRGGSFVISDTVWYDVLFVCANNSGKITLSPGVGQTDLGRVHPTAIAALADNCNGAGDCNESVVYPSRVADAYPGFKTLCPNTDQTTKTTEDCFKEIYRLDSLACQNNNGTITQIRTKGLCASVAAKNCTSGDPQDPEACPTEDRKGYRFFTSKFIDPDLTGPGSSLDFQFVEDAACLTCVDNSDTAGACPTPPKK
jgi:hypothetical protein